jgi:hypothetical protein
VKGPPRTNKERIDATRNRDTLDKSRPPASTAAAHRAARAIAPDPTLRQASGHPFPDYDRDPDEALRNLCDLSGVFRDRVGCVSDNVDLDNVITRARMKKLLESQHVSDPELTDAFIDAAEISHPLIPLCICSACGVKNFDPLRTDFLECLLDDAMAALLQVTAIDVADWDRRRARARLAPDLVCEGGTRIRMIDVVNTAPNQIEIPLGSGTFYHLHEAGMIDFQPTGPRAQARFLACQSCRDSMSKRHLPQYSLAAGYSFGNLQGLFALGVPRLSAPEQIVLGPVRPFSTMIKLTPVDSDKTKIDTSGTRQTGLKGMRNVCFSSPIFCRALPSIAQPFSFRGIFFSRLASQGTLSVLRRTISPRWPRPALCPISRLFGEPCAWLSLARTHSGLGTRKALRLPACCVCLARPC